MCPTVLPWRFKQGATISARTVTEYSYGHPATEWPPKLVMT